MSAALDLGGQLEGVGIGLLLHGQDHCRVAHIAGVAALHARCVVNRRHLPQANGHALAIGHRKALQVLETCGARQIADQILPRVLIDEAPRSIGSELLEGGLNLGAVDIEGGHLREIEGDAILAHLATDRNDLGNAGDGEQPGTDDPVDHLTHLHRLSRHRWRWR